MCPRPASSGAHSSYLAPQSMATDLPRHLYKNYRLGTPHQRESRYQQGNKSHPAPRTAAVEPSHPHTISLWDKVAQPDRSSPLKSAGICKLVVTCSVETFSNNRASCKIPAYPHKTTLGRRCRAPAAPHHPHCSCPREQGCLVAMRRPLSDMDSSQQFVNHYHEVFGVCMRVTFSLF